MLFTGEDEGNRMELSCKPIEQVIQNQNINETNFTKLTDAIEFNELEFDGIKHSIDDQEQNILSIIKEFGDIGPTKGHYDYTRLLEFRALPLP